MPQRERRQRREEGGEGCGGCGADSSEQRAVFGRCNFLRLVALRRPEHHTSVTATRRSRRMNRAVRAKILRSTPAGHSTMDTPHTGPRYFPDADWQRKTPADAGIDARLPPGRDRPRDRSRSEEPARSRAQPLPDVRPRAFRLRDRPDQGSRRADGPRRAQGLHRRRMGRAAARRHDAQHHQKHALDASSGSRTIAA